MNEPKEVIDGDRLLQFIAAVKHMGNILENINIIEVKDTFLVGKQMGCIEKIIATRDQWAEAVNQITKSMEMDIATLESTKMVTTDTLVLLKKFSGLATNGEFNASITKIKELAELLDRIEAHKKSGLLETLITFGK